MKFSFEWCKNYPNPTTHIENIFDFHLFFHRAYRFFLISKNKNGFGVDQDYEKAIHWYRKAADQGDFEALRKLGEIL